jgi:hypothetical protein
MFNKSNGKTPSQRSPKCIHRQRLGNCTKVQTADTPECTKDQYRLPA